MTPGDAVRLVRVLGAAAHRAQLGPLVGRVGVVERVLPLAAPSGRSLRVVPERRGAPSVLVAFADGPEGVRFYCHGEELTLVGVGDGA